MPPVDYYNQKYYQKISRGRLRGILNFIKRPSVQILDIGCADGALGVILQKEKQAKVYGVDISETAVNLAKKKLVGAWVMDIEKDDWPSEIKNKKFDYIIISEVLEHLFQPEKVLEKLKPIITSDTEIIITVPNVLFWRNRLRILTGYFEYTDEGLMDRGHIHFFTWQSLNKILWQTGYEITAINHHVPTRGTKFLSRFFPGLFAYQFIIKIRKKRKVVYTAIFGNYDKLLDPKIISPFFDYICFTDFDIKSDVWKIIKVSPEYKDATRNARKYKILPHRYLSDYQISIWIDGNMVIKGDLDEAVEKYLRNNNMAVYDHSVLPNGEGRNCIYQEAESLLEMIKKGKPKDDPHIIQKQMEKYRKEGYPKDNGLISTMVIFRKHNDKAVIQVMEDWWQEVKDYSKRDQLSLNYVLWKNNFNPYYIKENSRDNKYFKNIPHYSKIAYAKS